MGWDVRPRSVRRLWGGGSKSWDGLAIRPTDVVSPGDGDFRWDGLAIRPTDVASPGDGDFRWDGLAIRPTHDCSERNEFRST
jgi:hypothetical protein